LFFFIPDNRSIALATAGLMCVGALSIGADGQTPAGTANQQYLLIHAIRNSSLRQELTEAGTQGYSIQFAADDRTGFGIVLKHDDAGPRAYRFIDTKKEGTFVTELTEAASQGFKLVFAKYNNISQVGALVQQSGGAQYKYSLVSGTDTATKALAECTRRGCALVAVLGDSLILEDRVGSLPLAKSRERDYRILATIKVSTLEKELKEAAEEGFRVIDAGAMRVVMEREPGVSAAPLDYRVVASGDSRDAVRKLHAAGIEGFRIAVALEPKDQGVFVLQRAQGTSERFDYQILKLEQGSINGWLLYAEAQGYRMVAFVSGLALLERPLSGKPRSH
jgi:hypothetical protein